MHADFPHCHKRRFSIWIFLFSQSRSAYRFTHLDPWNQYLLISSPNVMSPRFLPSSSGLISTSWKLGVPPTLPNPLRKPKKQYSTPNKKANANGDFNTVAKIQPIIIIHIQAKLALASSLRGMVEQFLFYAVESNDYCWTRSDVDLSSIVKTTGMERDHHVRFLRMLCRKRKEPMVTGTRSSLRHEDSYRFIPRLPPAKTHSQKKMYHM